MVFFVDMTNVPKEEVATMWFKSVKDFIESGKRSSLREVHLVDTDSGRLDLVKSYFDQCIP